jgi:hypothetical protein
MQRQYLSNLENTHKVEWTDSSGLTQKPSNSAEGSQRDLHSLET